MDSCIIPKVLGIIILDYMIASALYILSTYCKGTNSLIKDQYEITKILSLLDPQKNVICKAIMVGVIILYLLRLINQYHIFNPIYSYIKSLKKNSIFNIKIIIILIYLFQNNLMNKKVNRKAILAHRGYWQTYNEQNTIKSVQEAIKRKFKGVEIDIFYDESISDFVISHDPYDDPTNLLSLKQVLELDIPTYFIFWLDLKNLSLKNAFSCRKKFIQYNKKFNNIFMIVESSSYMGLLIVSSLSNIKTSYWIDHWIQLLLPQLLFTFTSLIYTHYDNNQLLYNLFSKNPINLFSINNKNKLKSYYSMEKISILLTKTEINERNFYKKNEENVL